MSSKKPTRSYASSSSSKVSDPERQKQMQRQAHLEQMLIDNQRSTAARRLEMARLRRENLAKGFAALDAELPEAFPRRTQVRVLNDATDTIRELKNQAGKHAQADF